MAKILSEGALGFRASSDDVRKAVAQATNKSTAVTLNGMSGRITLQATAIATDSVATFQLNNDAIQAGDTLVLNHESVGSFGRYILNARCANGSAQIDVGNPTAGSLAEAIVIGFVVVRAQKV